MAAPRLDPAAELPPRLGRYLRQRAPELGRRSDPALKKFAHGQSNPTFLVEFPGGGECVLRMKPAGPLPSSAHAVEREHEVQAALCGRIPVPRMILLERDASHLGTPFYLMEFVRGRCFLDAALPALTVPERRAVYASAMHTLAALHRVDPAAVGLSGYGPTSNYYARQLRRLSSVSAAQAEAAPPLLHLAAALDWFGTHLPASESAIVHGDYKIDNLLFSAADGAAGAGAPRVVAVLDWELSTLGHPMADVANFSLVYQLPGGGGAGRAFGGLSGLLGEPLGLATAGIPTEDELVEAYCAAAGRAFPEPRWPFFKAFALLRMAVIAQGIAARAARGTASDVHASSGAAAAAAALLMELCIDAQRAGGEAGVASAAGAQARL